jgi:hypothetical protein
MSMTFPEIFNTGIIPEDRSKLALLADGLTAWGICMTGTAPTKHFGDVLVIIGNKLNVSPTAENLSMLFDKWKEAGKPLDFFD